MTNVASTNDVKKNTVETKSFYISIFAPLMGLQEFQKYVQDGYVLDISQPPRKRGNNLHLTLVNVAPIVVYKPDDVVTPDSNDTSKTTNKRPIAKVATKVSDKVEVKDV